MKRTMTVYAFTLGYLHALLCTWDFIADRDFESYEEGMAWLNKVSSWQRMGGKLALWLLEEAYDVEKYNLLPKAEASDIARSMEEMGDVFLVEVAETSKQAAVHLSRKYDLAYMTCMYNVYCSVLNRSIWQFDVLFERLARQVPALRTPYFSHRHKWRVVSKHLHAELTSFGEDVQHNSGHAREFRADVEKVGEHVTRRWKRAIDEAAASYGGS